MTERERRDALLKAQEHKGYGEDEGEREAALAASEPQPAATHPQDKDTDNFEVNDNPRELRYELSHGRDLVGELKYRLEPGVVVLVHTEIEPSLEGRGLASTLIRGALDDVRQKGLKVTPLCPFARSFIDRHPEYADLVAVDPAATDD